MIRFLAALAGAVAIAGTALASPAKELDTLFAEYWSYELAENPFSATYAGVADYNDRAPDASPAADERRAKVRKAFLERLDAADVSGVSETRALSANLLRFILKHDIALAEFDAWRIPFVADGGFHTDMGYVVSATPFRTEKDYADYLARLKALPGYLDQNVANMRQGIADGFVQPKEIMPLILPSFEAQATPAPKDHPLYAPFSRMPASIVKSAQKRLADEGEAVLRDAVLPAFRRVHAFMRDEYMPAAGEGVGVSGLPQGSEYYDALVRFYTTRDGATADAIHKLGLKEVKRIRGEMQRVMKKAGFKGSFAEFLEFLRTDPQFYAKTPQELLDRAAWISKDADGKLPAFFGKLPRQPYSVEPVPAAIAENYTTGRYSGAPPGASRGGEYWVNTSALDKRPLYELPALTLHEAVPGHHLQIALSYEIENAPEFRKQFYPHAFGEGWGLYAEKLGVEMGMYNTPYEEFGRLSYEMWRACRLVIDTGIHSKGWTRQEALDYLASNTALSMKNVQTEVDRYIAWPGQALAYKMGELTLWELRRKAERALGEKFDIRTFHDAVLTEGGLPLEILRERIDAHIAREKAKE